MSNSDMDTSGCQKQIHKIFAKTYKKHDPCHTSVVNNEGINQTSKLNAEGAALSKKH